MLSIAASLSLKISAQDLERISAPQDMDSLPYEKIKESLDAERVIQRQHGVFIEDILLVRPSIRGQDLVRVVLDAPAEGTPIPTGEVYEEKGLHGERIDLDRLFSPNGFVKDRYGVWLIGYAPIFDQDEHYLATVLVSVRSDRILQEMRPILVYGIFAWLFSTVICFCIAIVLGKKFSFALWRLCEDVRTIKKGHLENPIHLETEDEFSQLASAIDDMRQGLQERENLKQNFSRYVSSHILEEILHSNTSISLMGESRKITVLFADIRDFTTLAEDHSAEKVVALLNEYFQYMLDAIFAHHGTLDKFLGDGIMVEFGSPLDDAQQELHAVECALAMQQSLEVLLKKWDQEGNPKISIGIGIHTGNAVVGNIGTEERMEYTAVGDAVNVAARIEKKTKEFSVPILVSEETQKALQKSFFWEDLGLVHLAGREKKIRVFTLKKHPRVRD